MKDKQSKIWVLQFEDHLFSILIKFIKTPANKNILQSYFDEGVIRV